MRRSLYYHHGIYVGDDQVVQFGGRIRDKPHAKIHEVSLACFLRGGQADVVEQGRLTWLGLWKLPPALPPERIVARARCLARTQSEGAYNLIGRNCETVALWCVCGMGESLQRQRFQLVNTMLGGPFLLYIASLSRSQRGSVTARQFFTILGTFVLRWALLFAYYRHNRRFYQSARLCQHL